VGSAKEKDKILLSLFRDYTEPIRDPLWRHIYLTKPLKKIIEAPAFQKLKSIKQLGPAHLVYPGATHTRMGHSLGVFEIAKRLITELAKKDDSDRFTIEGINAFLCAALLHDVGHYPYAHSLKDLDIEYHERLTAKLIREETFGSLIKNQLGIDPYDIAAIVDEGIEIRNRKDIEYFRNLLSGVLDPDKLDYLNRDAFFCGIPYGVQDVDFILSEVHPHAEKGIAVTQRGLVSIESILFSKYLMYKTVYWHKTVRIATAMIKKAIFTALEEGAIKKEELYSIDDNGLFLLARTKKLPLPSLIDNVLARNLHKQVFRMAFDESNEAHCRIEDMNGRRTLEAEMGVILAKKTGISYSKDMLIIDIPERISFEMDVPVIDLDTRKEISYEESGSVFDANTVSGFSKSIRFISVFVARREELLEAARGLDFGALINGN
jgi:uncharacterized protein